MRCFISTKPKKAEKNASAVPMDAAIRKRTAVAANASRNKMNKICREGNDSAKFALRRAKCADAR